MTEPPTETGAEASPGTQPPAASATQNPRGAIIFVGIAMLVVPIVLLGGLKGCSSEAAGSVQVTGRDAQPGGNFTFTATACHSLVPYGRHGVNVHGDGHNDGAIYASMDPIEGPRIDLEVPGSCRNADGTDCTVFRLPRERCSTFDVHVGFTNTTVNDVRLLEGSARIDCTLEDGTHAEGSVTFGGCG